jgi:hypothetical protein
MCGARRMNKAIRLNTILFLIAVLMSCSAFALGIGTNNKVIGYEPNVPKSASIYIINDEHKDMNVEISVAGSLAEYAKAPKTLFVSASEEIKKFSINFTLPKGLEEGDLKVIVSEATAQNSQIGAKVHAVAEIKIDFSASAAKEEDVDVKKVDVKEQQAGLQKLAPSEAAKYSTIKALLIPLIAIIIIVIIDLIFYFRKRRAKLYPGHLSELGKL